MRKEWPRMISCLVIAAMIVTLAGVPAMADSLLIEESSINEAVENDGELLLDTADPALNMQEELVDCDGEDRLSVESEQQKNDGNNDPEILLTDETETSTEDEEKVESIEAKQYLDVENENIASGTYRNTTWVIDSKGTLSVNGTGNFRELYDSEGNYIEVDYIYRQDGNGHYTGTSPWFPYRDKMD